MVIEGSAGVWSIEAEQVWHQIIRSTSSLTGETVSTLANSLYQSLSMILHRSNARAILKRTPYISSNDKILEGASDCLAEIDVEKN